MDLPSIILINGRGPGTSHVCQIKFVTDNLVNCTIYKDQNKLKTTLLSLFILTFFWHEWSLLQGFLLRFLTGGRGEWSRPCSLHYLMIIHSSGIIYLFTSKYCQNPTQLNSTQLKATLKQLVLELDIVVTVTCSPPHYHKLFIHF